jgi:hypothetical protein
MIIVLSLPDSKYTTSLIRVIYIIILHIIVNILFPNNMISFPNNMI